MTAAALCTYVAVASGRARSAVFVPYLTASMRAAGSRVSSSECLLSIVNSSKQSDSNRDVSSTLLYCCVTSSNIMICNDMNDVCDYQFVVVYYRVAEAVHTYR